MSMKSKMVKAICALTAMSIVSCASITGFAATYTTTTTYTAGSDVVSVESQVSGVGATEQVTYLVHNSSGTIADDNIIYINQTAADATGAVSFIYNTTKTKIGRLGSTVLVGAQTTTPAPTPVASIDATLTPYTITVTAPVNGTVTQIADGDKMGANEVVPFTVTPVGSYGIRTIFINGISQPIFGNDYSVTGDGDKAIAIAFQELIGDSTIVDGSATAIIYPAAPENNFISTFGTVSITAADEPTAEFGILFAVGEKSGTELVIGGAGVTKYEALDAGTEGKFTVKLLNGDTGFIINQTYSTRTYLQVGTEIQYGAVQVTNPSL